MQWPRTGCGADAAAGAHCPGGEVGCTEQGESSCASLLPSHCWRSQGEQPRLAAAAPPPEATVALSPETPGGARPHLASAALPPEESGGAWSRLAVPAPPPEERAARGAWRSVVAPRRCGSAAGGAGEISRVSPPNSL